jgi:predicted transcriptional regulator
MVDMTETAPPRDEQAVRRFVDQTAGLLAEWGLPRMVARVLLALTVAANGTATAAELGEQLQASPAAISGAVRYLVQWGMVTREPVSGSRRNRYRIGDHAWYDVTVSKSWAMKRFADLADQGIGTVGGDQTAPGARLVEIRDFLLFTRDELDAMLTRWQQRRPRR